jgi:arylsulfatase A-like enzyme
MPHLPISTAERFRGRSPAGRYGDVIEELDWSVGEIQKALTDLSLDRNTLQVFMSDNGPWINAGTRMWQEGMTVQDVGTAGALRESKGSTYEGGVRVPGIVRWPAGVPAGRVSSDMASNLDWLPTFAHLAGAPLPAGLTLDGNDITALLKGTGPSATREFIYFAGNTPQAVRQSKWKLRVAPAGRQGGAGRGAGPGGGAAGADPLVELYDMDADPYERDNVAPAHPEIVARLRARLDAVAAEVLGSGAQR